MEEKLQFVPSLKDAFAIGVKNLVPIVLSVLLWLVTVWIPYVNVGTTIALATLPVKLSKGEMISPMFIFDSEYRHCMGEYFILQALISSAVVGSLSVPVNTGCCTLVQLAARCLSACRQEDELGALPLREQPSDDGL